MRAPTHGWHPRSRMVAVGDTWAHTIDSATAGPPLVLLHGIMVSSWCWRHNIPVLADRFRTIAFCHKGFGWSGKPRGRYDVPALAEFALGLLDTLGIERAHLVGNSLGGAVALQLALDHPDRVDRLALLAPAAVPLGVIQPFLRLQGPWFGPIYRAAGTSLLYRAVLRSLVYHELEVDREYMRWFMEPLRGGATERISGHITRALGPDVRRIFARLPELAHQTLLVWGAHDGLVPLRAGHILDRKIPNSRLVVFPDAGHCPMEERPERFNRLLLEHLGSDPS